MNPTTTKVFGKQFLSFLLTLVMVLSMCPTMVFVIADEKMEGALYEKTETIQGCIQLEVTPYIGGTANVLLM